jgi:hypothetical protein
MKQRVGVVALLVLLGALPGAHLRAQSLGDLAQKEKEKREAAKATGTAAKVYGEKDLATYAEERPPEEASAEGTSATPAMSATPKAGSGKKPATAPTREAENREVAERREAEDRKADAESLRARWQEAQRRVAAADRTLAASEAEMKTLPPGLPAGNYYDDIQAAVEQQKVEREQRNILAKKALVAAKEALDAVETEARRKQVRLE